MGRRSRREVPSDRLQGQAAPPPDADIDLHDAFLSLDTRTRLPAILYYIEGYDINETARMLRLPAGTVKSRLHRARAHLRERLKEDIDDA